MATPLTLTRTITSPAAPSAVFAYLKDFRTTEEWEPATVRTTLVDGEGEVGSAYDNESRFAGRTVRLRYVVTELVPDEVVELRGEGASVVTHDRMTLRSLPDGGTEVTYRADFHFSGIAGAVSPLLRPLVSRLGDRAEDALERALSSV